MFSLRMVAVGEIATGLALVRNVNDTVIEKV